MREKNLAHLLIIAHREGIPAAMEEWRRGLDEKEKVEPQQNALSLANRIRGGVQAAQRFDQAALELYEALV